jgi:hypothetical protein
VYGNFVTVIESWLTVAQYDWAEKGSEFWGPEFSFMSQVVWKEYRSSVVPNGGRRKVTKGADVVYQVHSSTAKDCREDTWTRDQMGVPGYIRDDLKIAGVVLSSARRSDWYSLGHCSSQEHTCTSAANDTHRMIWDGTSHITNWSAI